MKRLFDLVATGAGCLLIWPVLLVLALLVRIKHGAPVFFRQQRPDKRQNGLKSMGEYRVAS